MSILEITLPKMGESVAEEDLKFLVKQKQAQGTKHKAQSSKTVLSSSHQWSVKWLLQKI